MLRGAVEHVVNVKPAQGSNAEDDKDNVEHEPSRSGGSTPRGAICRLCKKVQPAAGACSLQLRHASIARNMTKGTDTRCEDAA